MDGVKGQADEPRVVRRERAERFVLYMTVSCTGAAVMMLELLGTRIIGPFYGVSLFVWSSLISVALIALAAGYFLGGLAADRWTGFRLSYAVALAAFFSAIIPLISAPVLELTNALGVRAGAFSSALLLFAAPLTFLGMVGPHVIKLSVRRLENVGTASGSIYAVSTVGSVVGTLLMGFFLLPAVGSRMVLYSVSAALFVLAGLLALYESRWLRRPVSVGLVVGLALLGGGLLAGRDTNSKAAGEYELLYEAESLYGWIRVVDQRSNGVRWMLSDASTLSATYPGLDRPIFSYLKMLELLPYAHPGGREALLIGLGGGYIVGALAKHGVVTDAVEIDPKVVEAARAYFGFKPTGALLVGDARYEISKLRKRYDFILHDSFTGGSIPAHLLSAELLTDLRGLLADDGLLALVFVGFSQGEKARAVASVYRTVESVFEHQRVFVSQPGRDLSDFLFLASRQPIELQPDRVPSAEGQKALAWLVERECDLAGTEGVVISDDFNPLESMQVAKAEAYRQLLLERLGSDLLLW